MQSGRKSHPRRLDKVWQGEARDYMPGLGAQSTRACKAAWASVSDRRRRAADSGCTPPVPRSRGSGLRVTRLTSRITAKPTGTPNRPAEIGWMSHHSCDRGRDAEHAAQPGLRRDHVIRRGQQPGDHAQRGRDAGGTLPENAQRQGRKERRGSERERRRDQEQDVGRLLRRHICRRQRHHQQQHLGQGHAPRGRRIGIDHLVVQVVAQRIGDRQQQAIGRGQAPLPDHRQRPDRTRHTAGRRSPAWPAPGCRR